MEGEYDREQISRSLRESAELAEWFYRSHLQAGLGDTGAASKRDELLARMTVYKHLQAGEFLDSKDSLLTELRWMLKHERPLAPRQTLDQAMFARHRAKLLQMLIQRFEAPGEASNADSYPEEPGLKRSGGLR